MLLVMIESCLKEKRYFLISAKAIEESRVLMVIFSKNYASSTWCLRELVKILECKETGKPKHEVRIIFYDVKPDVVRKQKKSYAKTLAKHDVLNRTEVDIWKEALTMAANLSGDPLQNMTNGFESKFITKISNDIFQMLHDGPLHVGENLVGVASDEKEEEQKQWGSGSIALF
ncbi:NB-ARC domains-containing protein [Tanacetum coccineum]